MGSVLPDFVISRKCAWYLKLSTGAISQKPKSTQLILLALQSNPCQHPIVILRDISEADLSSLLRFMYHGEVRIEEERLKDFMRAAETLQIRGLFGDDNDSDNDHDAADATAAADDSKEVCV